MPTTTEKKAAQGPAHLAFVDALRGWAILGVIATHVGAFGPIIRLPEPFNEIRERGRMGVQLFFVISALTLFLSCRSRFARDRHPTRAFFIRRLFRIAPMFWASIPLYFYVPLAAYGGPAALAPDGVTWKQVLLTATFLHGWYPTSIQSVVPGGWSIAVEMTFYLCVPFLFLRIKTIRSAAILSALAILASVAYNVAMMHILPYRFPSDWWVIVCAFIYFSFPSQFAIFCLGLLLFRILDANPPLGAAPMPPHRARLQACAAAAGALFLVFVPMPHFLKVYDQYALVAKTLLASFGFVLLAWGLSKHPLYLFVNPVTRFIGTVSFSAYLWHFLIMDKVTPPVVDWLRLHPDTPVHALLEAAFVFALTLLVTVMASWVTYRLIEVPGQTLGKKLIDKLGYGAAQKGAAPEARTMLPGPHERTGA